MLTARCRSTYVLDVAKATRPRKPEDVRLDCFTLGVRFAAASPDKPSIEVFLASSVFPTPIGFDAEHPDIQSEARRGKGQQCWDVCHGINKCVGVTPCQTFIAETAMGGRGVLTWG